MNLEESAPIFHEQRSCNTQQTQSFTVSEVATAMVYRIQAQGFCNLDMVGSAIGTSFASPMILWALAPFAALGAILCPVIRLKFCTTAACVIY